MLLVRAILGASTGTLFNDQLKRSAWIM